MTAAGFTFPGKRRDEGRPQDVSPHDPGEYPEAQQRENEDEAGEGEPC
jgi:hypothetical protein